MRLKTADHRDTELQRFQHAFSDENILQQRLAELFRRVPNVTNVNVLQGAQEYGKDLVFYAPVGISGPGLFACVVKNTPITGSVSSTSGARTVLHQAELAFDTPYINPLGEEGWVTRVYVITPYECSPEAMHSIRGALKQRSGQTEFLHGHALLDLFRDHWQSFLDITVGWLTGYLSHLEKTLAYDTAFASLIRRHGLAIDMPESFRSVYVRPNFFAELALIRARNLSIPDPDLLSRAWNRDRLMEVGQQLRNLSPVLELSPMWAREEDQAAWSNLGGKIGELPDKLQRAWKSAYAQDERQRSKENAPALRASEVALTLSLQQSERENFSELMEAVQAALGAFDQKLERAALFAETPAPEPLKTLRDPEYLAYCEVEEISRELPNLLRRDNIQRLSYSPDLLEQLDGSVLITAPAGYGKSCFCKWYSLHDAEQLRSNQASILPVYVPLHRLSQGELATPEQTFLAELPSGASGREDSQIGNYKIVRLYLDGLDEVPSQTRQREIVDLVRSLLERHPEFQIVITARDYVSGPWLGWLPRVRLNEFNDHQVKELVRNWLKSDEQIAEFHRQLDKSLALRPLMSVPLLGTLIIAVFQMMRSLPESRVKLYEIFIELLSGGWDAIKQVQRESRFGPHVKIMILNRLARQLHLAKKREATDADFSTAVRDRSSAMANDWRLILEEVLRDGLLTRVGSQYTFCHQSFQEFMTAKDFWAPKRQRADNALSWFLSGDDWWREVLVFYIALSGQPAEMDQWIEEGVQKIFSKGRNARKADLESRWTALRQSIQQGFPLHELTPLALSCP